MSVEKLVELKVVIVLSEGVVEGLGNPEPAKDEEEPTESIKEATTGEFGGSWSDWATND